MQSVYVFIRQKKTKGYSPPEEAMACSTSSLSASQGFGNRRCFSINDNRKGMLQTRMVKRRDGIMHLRLIGLGKISAKCVAKSLYSESSTRSGDPQNRKLLVCGESPCQSLPCSRINKASNLIRVAVDVDEVLGSFLISLNAFVEETYQSCYDISEYYVYDFMKIWKCSQAEANHRVHAFFKSKHFNDGIKPIPGAYQALCKLSSFCDLVVVTSRQHVIRQPTLEWISRHFKGLFSEIHFGNHFALEGHPISKSEICKSLKVQFLIDDNPRYAVECAEEGINVLLFDLDHSYPWSKTVDGNSHRLITRVNSWQEVEIRLLAYVNSL